MSHVELTQVQKISRGMAEMEAQMDLAVLEDKIVVTKAAGRKRLAKEKAVAFKKASSPEEYETLVANLAPIASVEEKTALRKARKDFRKNHRTLTSGDVEVDIIGVEDN